MASSHVLVSCISVSSRSLSFYLCKQFCSIIISRLTSIFSVFNIKQLYIYIYMCVIQFINNIWYQSLGILGEYQKRRLRWMRV